MATNMALDSVTTTSITVHGWYGGTTPVYYGKMYCNGSLFANNYSAAGSTNWTLPSVAKLNLEPDTQYGFTCVFYAANNTTVIESSSTFYWKTDPLPDLPSPTLQSYTKTATSVSVTLATIYPSGSTYHAELNGSSQTSSDRYFTFSGLQPNTIYTLSTYASKSGYNNSTISTANVITDNLGTLSTPSIISQTVTQTSISLTFGAVEHADTYYTRRNGGAWQSGSYPGPFNFTGLADQTTYSFEFYCTGTGYITSGTGSVSITTGLPKLSTPSIASQIVAQTSITINLTSIGGATTYYARINSGVWQSGANVGPFIFTGLTFNTTYTIDFYCSGSGYTNSDIGSASIKTSSISDWTGFDYISSETTMTISGSTIYVMSANLWNGFTTRINEFRDYFGLPDYSFTTVYKDTNCSASIINEAINAINALGFSQSTVSSGTNISASIFLTMKNNLNSLI